MVPATRLNWCRTNRFHVYLMAYGLFRFANEWMRDDARFLGPLSVYHLFAAAIFVLGLMRYISRAQRLNHTAPTLPA
jgi:prolipoprotein diacylglyceryltransferase